MIFKNANVFLSDKNAFVKTDIEIKDGKIITIEENINKSGIKIIDCSGKYILPGFIDAHSHAGLIEEGIRWEGDDMNEASRNTTPALRSIDGIKPTDSSFNEYIEAGVTTISVDQGSANVVGGLCSVISTHGIVIDDMIIKLNSAMKCALGENPKNASASPASRKPFTRMAIAEILRETILNTRIYIEKKEYFKKSGDYFELNFDYEALIPVIENKIPLKIHAHRADDIMTAIRLSKELDVKIIIVNATEAHLIADYIKKSNVSIINGISFSGKIKYETINESFETASVLSKNNIDFAITINHSLMPSYSLNMAVMLACRHGLDEIEGLKSITINAAKILGIDSFKGKIALTYDADLAIWDKHPLDIMAKTDMVLIKGDIVRGQL